MLKTYDFHSFIQRPHFSQIAKNDFRATFFTPADIAAYIYVWRTQTEIYIFWHFLEIVFKVFRRFFNMS